jgi:hypothetical protein
MCRAVYSALAAGVDEALIVLSTDPGGDILFADRHPGGAQPLFPFVGGLRLFVGVKQHISTKHAATFLGFE